MSGKVIVMTRTSSAVSPTLPLFFGEGFFHDHVGQILDDPSIAILELVANSYDAGAEKVDVIWPDLPGDVLSVSDNGTGMTRQQFERRWRTLSYDRQVEQGADVDFPPGVKKRKRTAFGHNGKGRFSPFCFADKYEIETWRDGNGLKATVEIARDSTVPFSCSIESEFSRKGYGTKISVRPDSITLSSGSIRDLIGFKFAVDPSFQVTVNGEQVMLLELASLSSQDVTVSGLGTVRLHRLDPRKQERTLHLKGIAWWVNKRMVGEPSWDGLDAEGKYLDGRTSEAKRFSFVVEADLLREQVKADWSGFHANSQVNAVRLAIHDAVVQELRGLLADERKETKKAALSQNRALIKDLPQVSRNQIGRFLEQIQEKCPNLTARDLGRTVEIWGKLEQSRTGYDLLGRLATCAPEDLDTWNRLMEQWTASNAEVVLNELDRRIKLIRQLQTLIRDKNTDEVHDLQPLFERGLWMFGPEYESVEFSSNRGMAHVVREFFGKKGAAVSKNRPDFVALPDSSIGIYSADEFKDGEVSAIRKVLIVELKKGGFEVKQQEVDQARDYARELRRTQAVQPTTKIEGFVLGASIEEGLEELKTGETVVKPFQYDLLLNRAHSRIFNLAKRIKESSPNVDSDVEVEDVLSQQLDFDGLVSAVEASLPM
jgi:hypothetical protein